MARPAPRLLAAAALMLAGGSIYALPYLRQSFYRAMLEGFDITSTQLGLLNALFGMFALVCYVPGGWLADVFSARKLLSVSLVASGLGGLVFATFPPYAVVLALHGLWGISTILTFWAALIKATRLVAAAESQGRAFGLLDGGRGLVQSGLGAGAIGLFVFFGEGRGGLGAVMTMYALVTLAAGAATWLLLDERDPTEGAATSLSLADMRAVARLPVVWAHAGIILLAYAAYWGTFDLAAFATEGYGQTDVFGATVANFSTWLRPAAAIAAGFIADRVGTSGTVMGAFTMVALGYGALAVVPVGPATLWALWVETAVVAAAVFALRGVYFALLEQGGVPRPLTGTAVGFVSVVGFAPDVVMPLVVGGILDAFPGAAGHQYLHALLAACAVGGVIVTALHGRLSRAL